MTTSEALISEPDARTLARLARSGWTLADWQWEGCSWRAARAFTQTGRTGDAAADWRRGLQIARRHFPGTDPRLPASLAANAAVLADTGSPAAADRLRAEAERAWSGAGAWVARMALDAPARSSIYHLRMELRHADAYARQRRQALVELVRRARAQVAQRRGDPEGPVAAPALDVWTADAPLAFTDRRKLVAALTLMPDPVTDAAEV